MTNYFNNHPIVFIESSDIDKNTKKIKTFGKKMKKWWFIMIQSAQCSHCVRAKPYFADASDIIKKPNFTFATIDCMADGNTAQILLPKLLGIPVFVLLNNITGKMVMYNGERTVDGFKKFLDATVID